MTSETPRGGDEAGFGTGERGAIPLDTTDRTGRDLTGSLGRVKPRKNSARAKIFSAFFRASMENLRPPRTGGTPRRRQELSFERSDCIACHPSIPHDLK